MTNTPTDPKGAVGATKTPLGLIPPFAMAQTAWAHKLGAEKYGPFNWRDTGVCASTYVNAMLRHLNAWRDGEDLDPESGISHLAHIACNCNILLDAGFCRTLQDDRNVTPQNWLKPEQKFEEPEYRFLQTGEKIKAGDQFLHQETLSWREVPNLFVGLSSLPCYKNQTRRKAKPIAPVYRDLERGDALQEGDEIFDWTSNEWIPTNSVGSRAGSAHYRREIKPEPVYRKLEVGETIQEGDEYYDDCYGWWCKSSAVGCNVLCLTYRRKIEPEPEPKLEPTVEPVYRMLEVGELLREDDEVYIKSEGWQTYGAGGHPVQPPWSPLNPAGYYRRKIEPEADAYGAECMCGRLLINHYTLGMICEDCDTQWQDPY